MAASEYSVLVIEQVERAMLSNKECHILGDFNFCFIQYTQTNISQNSQTGRLKNLIDLWFENIIPLGFSQCVQSPTRFWPGLPDSGLDHSYSNQPSKLSDVQAVRWGGSDHKYIFGARYSKSIQKNVRYVKKRSYKHFNPVKFSEEISNISWWDVYCCTDVNEEVNLFSNKICSILDVMAPVKVFQTRTMAF